VIILTALEYIRERGFDEDVYKHLFESTQTRREKQRLLYERYKASNSGVPIFTRELADENKVNNKINNDFFSQIVNNKTGYLAGLPFVYSYEGTDTEKERIQEIYRELHTDDLDAEIVKDLAIAGEGYRILYVDSEGVIRCMNEKTNNLIAVENESGNIEFAVRIIKQINIDNTEVLKLEFYDSTTVKVYLYDNGLIFQDEYNHLFDVCPVIHFLNNNEKLGDAEKVLSLIDAYDRTLSDVNSEIESFRLAYMIFKGVRPTAEDIAAAKQTGAFGIESEDDVKFLVKDLNDTIIENHLDRIERNINIFSNNVNFNDERFGNESGEAKKYKLIALENKCAITQRKLNNSLTRMFEVYSTASSKKGINIDPSKLTFVFKRNLPLDLLYHADIQMKLKGLISDETRLELFPAVDDAQYEKKLMLEEIANAYPEVLSDDEENG